MSVRNILAIGWVELPDTNCMMLGVQPVDLPDQKLCRSSQRHAAQPRIADGPPVQATPHSFAQRLLKRTETVSGSAGGRGNSVAMHPPTPQRSRAETTAETDLLVAKIDDVLAAVKAKPAPDTTALASLDEFRSQLSKQVSEHEYNACASDFSS